MSRVYDLEQVYLGEYIYYCVRLEISALQFFLIR